MFLRKKIEDIYEIFENEIIHEYYHNFLKIIYKTEANIHPSEILINYGFVTKSEYIDIMNKHYYDDKMREVVIEELLAEPNISVFDLKKMTLLEEIKETIRGSLKTLSDSRNLIPICILNNDTIIWIYKEPETYKPVEASHILSYQYNPSDIDHKSMVDYANKITSQCKFTKNVVYMVNNVDYVNIVSYLNKYYNEKHKYNEFDFNIRYFVRKKLIEGVVKKASDIYFWGTNIGNKCHLEHSYTILNDNVQGKRLPCTRAQLNEVNSEIWAWNKVAEETRSDYGVRNYSISNVLSDPPNNIRFTGRANIVGDPTSGDKVCIRIIESNKSIVSFKDFNISQRIKEKILKTITLNDFGIIVVAGTMGSGKSTLLRSLLDTLKDLRPYDRIESIEAPIEAIIPNITQINIDDSNILTPTDIIEALTRRNPKIINLNEINNHDLLKFTIDSALMQLFVLTTIHTSNVSSIPDRVKGLLTGDSQFLYGQFLDNIKMLMHLTMLKEACPDCCELVNRRQDPRITETEIELMDWYGYTSDEVYMPKADLDKRDYICPKCENRGFLINKPIVCVEYLEINSLLAMMLKAVDPLLVSSYIQDILMKEGTTGVHDALSYMRDNKVTWDMIYKKFSLFVQRFNHLKTELSSSDYINLKGGK